MSFFIAGAVLVSTATSAIMARKQQKAQERAQKKAEEDALEADRQARKAEVFAETEGEGLGQLGQISLEVDDELDEDEEISAGNVRI